MDGISWGVVGIAITGVATLAGSWFTRRSAKDTNAVTGFVSLTTALEHRVSRLEEREERRSELAQQHRPWDVQIFDQARQAGWDVKPPPPLD